MKNHLKTQHPDEDKKTPEENVNPPAPSTSSEASKKRGGTYSELYVLCQKKRRVELFQKTIPDWVDTKTKMDFHSPKSMKLHKSIFEVS